MRESIGSTQLLFIVITLVVVIMMLISSSISYSKAFKAKNAILNIVQKNASYDDTAEAVLNKSEAEIGAILADMGYKTAIDSSHDCSKPNKHRNILIDYAKSNNYNFCVFHFQDEGTESQFYGIETFMYFELPVFGRNDRFSFPIFGETYMFFKTE